MHQSHSGLEFGGLTVAGPEMGQAMWVVVLIKPFRHNRISTQKLIKHLHGHKYGVQVVLIYLKSPHTH